MSNNGHGWANMLSVRQPTESKSNNNILLCLITEVCLIRIIWHTSGGLNLNFQNFICIVGLIFFKVQAVWTVKAHLFEV